MPAVPDVWYAHRGLHDAGSGLTAQYANESGEYVALARRMAMKAGYGSPDTPGVIALKTRLPRSQPPVKPGTVSNWTCR